MHLEECAMPWAQSTEQKTDRQKTEYSCMCKNTESDFPNADQLPLLIEVQKSVCCELARRYHSAFDVAVTELLPAFSLINKRSLLWLLVLGKLKVRYLCLVWACVGSSCGVGVQARGHIGETESTKPRTITAQQPALGADNPFPRGGC